MNHAERIPYRVMYVGIAAGKSTSGCLLINDTMGFKRSWVISTSSTPSLKHGCMLGFPSWVRLSLQCLRLRPTLFQGIVIEGGASVNFINRSKYTLDPPLEVPPTLHSGSCQCK